MRVEYNGQVLELDRETAAFSSIHSEDGKEVTGTWFEARGVVVSAKQSDTFRAGKEQKPTPGAKRLAGKMILSGVALRDRDGLPDIRRMVPPIPPGFRRLEANYNVILHDAVNGAYEVEWVDEECLFVPPPPDAEPDEPVIR